MKTKMSLKEWLPLIGMTISAFLVNTSEFMPIGLLTDISNDFNMTAAQAGVMITAYSWTVTILSLPLMLLACKIEPKKLLLGTLTVFSTCQVLSVISIGFPFLVVSRIGVAVHILFSGLLLHHLQSVSYLKSINQKHSVLLLPELLSQWFLECRLVE